MTGVSNLPERRGGGDPPPASHADAVGTPSARRGWLSTAGAAAVAACLPAKASSAAGPAKGSTPASVDRSGRVTATRLDALVAASFGLFNRPAVLPDFSAARHGARHDVDLHRLVAPFTIPETGETVTVSGLLALPAGARGPLPVVSWQHGTVLSFDAVPSKLLKLADASYQPTESGDSLETLFNVHRFAGQGYAVVAADYVGKGPFRRGRGEGYAVRDMTTRTCVTILDAGLAAMKSLGIAAGPLFLNGWSQGGLNTQWLHQELCRRRRPIAGSAVASPFNDLSESFRFWAGAQSFPPPEGASGYPAMPDWVSLCMVITLGSYELNYGIEGLLQAAVRPEFRAMAARYWSDYSPDFDPAQPFPTGSTLLVPGFFERFTDDRNSAFLRRLAGNVTSLHRYDAPIRFYHGLADEALHPVMVGRALAAGGALATGVPVAGGSHRGNFIAALYGDAGSLAGRQNVVEWFDSRRR